MTGAVKITLQVVFLVAMVYVLAAIVGAAPGASVRGPGFRASIGKNGKRNRIPKGVVRTPVNAWVASGMVGELIASPGTNTPAVGPGAPPF